MGLCVCSAARAVLSGSGAANTTGVYSGTGSLGLDGTTVFGFDHVGQMHEGSVVYLGNGWILTAQHVNPGVVTLNDGTYNPSATGPLIYQSNSINGNTSVDLKVLLLAPNATGVGLPNYSPMPLATSSPAVGTTVTLVGDGWTNGTTTPEYFNRTGSYNSTTWSGPSATSAGNNAGGYALTATTTEHWGLDNTVAGNSSATAVYTLYDTTNPTTAQVYSVLPLPFFNPGSTNPPSINSTSLNDYLTKSATARQQEGSFAPGDSGGGLFANGQLVGIADLVSPYSNQPANTTMFGNYSLPEDVATYAATILQTTKQGQWNASGGGAWTSANWYGYTPNDVGASANFENSITTDATVTIGSAITLANINFDTPNSVTVTGGSILLSYPDPAGGTTPRYAMLNTYQGTHTIASPLSLDQLTQVQVNTVGGALTLSGGITNPEGIPLEKIGAGMLTLGGPQSHAPGTVFNINGGKIRLNSDLGGAAEGYNVQLNLSNAGTAAVAIGSMQHLAGLALAAGVTATMDSNGGRAIFTNALSLGGQMGGWTSQLELANNDLVLNTTTANAASDLAMVTDMVKQGLGGSLGITSAAATPTRGLAVALSTDLSDGVGTFDGDTLTGPAVLVKYTYIGDATMDGVLGVDDFLAADNGYLMGLHGWANGDFNYDGTVNATDLNLLATAFMAQGDPLSVGFADQLETLSLSAPPEMVPEPASLGMLALGAGMLLRRGRAGKR
jgi:hypothetical protein